MAPRQQWRGLIETGCAASPPRWAGLLRVSNGAASLKRCWRKRCSTLPRAPRQQWRGLIETRSSGQPSHCPRRAPRQHWAGISNYTEYYLSNGIIEGVNSKVQPAKARASGYRNIQNFINMIYFLTGKLKFDYPLYST
ncbi:MAG TPA: transposase [Flavobacteriales bacterium]|nr:transposase [Flavobacteriales bacterium]